jgi:adenine phosphoribosyltransferase
MEAALCLVRKLGGNIAGACFLIEMANLRGREKLNGIDVYSMIKYEK